MGIGGAPLQTPERGVQQFISNITVEGLLRVDRRGRSEPWLAESWENSSDGRRLTVHLRSNAKFHDGSPVEAKDVVKLLQAGLPGVLRSVYEDIESISARSNTDIEFNLRRPSPFVAESLVDLPIQKPGKPPIGTGPFAPAPAADTSTNAATLAGNSHYYTGPPSIDRIEVSSYPNVRAAWADLLRDRVDMLYEVDFDAIDVTQSSKVGLYEFERQYQYIVLLNANHPKLKSREIRRALNQAIDRAAIVRDGLSQHGLISAGPVSPHHFGFTGTPDTFRLDPKAAERTLRAGGKGLTISCVTPAAAPYERLALLVKQQLAAVGVDFQVEEADPVRINKAFAARDYEAVLIDVLSGWNMFRPYSWWHSKGSSNKGYSSRDVDAALDRIKNAAGDDEYRAGVVEFQQAIAADPPAIFLAWGNRSRAVSKRFEIHPESGMDVIATMRMWKQTSADKRTSTH